MSSIRKTLRHLKLAKKLPIGEGAAAAPAADAVGDAARAAAAAEAAAGAGAVAAGARSERFQADGSLGLIEVIRDLEHSRRGRR
jgi:hypothetical protein